MGPLVMSFRGLCMHMTAASNLLPPGVGNRVVAVNATQGAKVVLIERGIPNLLSLPAHFCFLEADPPTTAALSSAGISGHLDGWNVQVVNGIGAFGPSSIADLPRLRTYVPRMQLLPNFGDVGAPGPDACCFVDMQAGTLEQHQYQSVSDPGYFTTWTVCTDGEPRLRFLARDGNVIDVTVPSTQPDEALSDGVFGSIVLHNSTTAADDDPFDFALYYLAAQGGIPSDFAHPLPGSQSIQTEFTDMTTSCSNSQFP